MCAITHFATHIDQKGGRKGDEYTLCLWSVSPKDPLQLISGNVIDASQLLTHSWIPTNIIDNSVENVLSSIYALPGDE